MWKSFENRQFLIFKDSKIVITKIYDNEIKLSNNIKDMHQERNMPNTKTIQLVLMENNNVKWFLSRLSFKPLKTNIKVGRLT